ncbi:hypothetical protein ACLOAU_13050 [Niabella sp. CJ426]|uniref:hypothetical protein n=1 Tax=Niabella sp. CJ426 TaxID=3393740 RepID=UPI003CFDB04B
MHIRLFIIFLALAITSFTWKEWHSKLVELKPDGRLVYKPDSKGNILPDFSRVGYETGNVAIPEIPVARTIEPGPQAADQIQQAIDELAGKPLNKLGFRGAIVLKKGRYSIKDQIKINASGIVLRGEGTGTTLIAEGTDKRPLIQVLGEGSIKEIKGTRTSVRTEYVPVGSFSIPVVSTAGFKKGDRIILEWNATEQWINDLKMNRIVERPGTLQWQVKEYRFQFQREVTGINGNNLIIDNPVVMEMDTKYCSAFIYKYDFNGRIRNIGVEHLNCESAYTADTSEDHSWNAISFDKVEHGWVRNVDARYFAFSCVNLGRFSKNISVLNCSASDHKSIITGGRRYSFNNDGQQNLFINCVAKDGRHDYVTGARVCGPNVFYNCKASNTHADIGPHHRWAMGTLYDNIETTGEMNVRDRGNWGSGHGWPGVNQIFWNCTARTIVVESPWVSGKNYAIGIKGKKVPGRLEGRPDGEWEGHEQDGLQPSSLYQAQLKARQLSLKRN